MASLLPHVLEGIKMNKALQTPVSVTAQWIKIHSLSDMMALKLVKKTLQWETGF